MILAIFTCVVGCVVCIFKMGFKPLTTQAFLKDRFVITPPHRDFEEVITNRVGVVFVLVSGLVWWRSGFRGEGEGRKEEERKKRGKFCICRFRIKSRMTSKARITRLYENGKFNRVQKISRYLSLKKKGGNI